MPFTWTWVIARWLRVISEGEGFIFFCCLMLDSSFITALFVQYTK